MTQIFIDALTDIYLENKNNFKILPYLFEINGKEYLSPDLSELDIFNFLQNDVHVKTARGPLGVWKNMIKESLDKGDDVFYIASTSVMTGALSTFNLIKSLLCSLYPNRIIESVDTLNTTINNYLLARIALRDLNNGCNIYTVKDKISNLSKKSSFLISLKDTQTFVNNNRLSTISKKTPVITMKSGMTVIQDEFECKYDSLNYIISNLSNIDDIIIVYSYDVNLDTLSFFKEKLEKKFNLDIPCVQLQSTMYSYMGLETIGVGFIEK